MQEKPVFAGFIRKSDGKEFPPDQVPEEFAERMVKAAKDIYTPKGGRLIKK